MRIQSLGQESPDPVITGIYKTNKKVWVNTPTLYETVHH
jgi:hypothetical protein